GAEWSEVQILSSRLFAEVTERPRVLNTINLVVGVMGFFAILAIFFFGGFLLMDFIFGRRGGDA
ncbi:MAG: hypothetical protein WKF44_08520, partial [Rubrobacteraceae bacterium]